MAKTPIYDKWIRDPLVELQVACKQGLYRSFWPKLTVSSSWQIKNKWQATQYALLTDELLDELRHYETTPILLIGKRP